MKAIVNFFKAINSTLNMYVDYCDTHVRTGKFIGDINYLLNRRFPLFVSKSLTNIKLDIQKSYALHAIRIALAPVWRTLLRIHLFENLVALFVDMIKIIIIFYTEIFIVFALTFPTSILLLNLFQEAITIFFIALLPILFWNSIVVSALYYCIERRHRGEKISIWQSFFIILHRFRSISFPAALYSALILEGIVGFFVFALLIHYAFVLVQISWISSFLYWFIVSFVGFFLLCGIFLLTIIMHQTYFIILFDDIPFTQALEKSKRHIKNYLPQYFFFFLLFSVYSALFIVRAVISYLYLGFIVSVFFAILIGVFLGFLLRRKFISKPLIHEALSAKKTVSQTLVAVILIFGFINYLLVARVITKNYQPILSFIQKQQDTFLASQRVKRFTNTTYHYTLIYPQTWSIYEWRDNTVTFYNNYTGTISGGTWLSIRVTPYEKNTFDYLYNATPGIVSYDPQTKNVVTKISNFSNQGYAGVNYTFVKSGKPYPQYETHYLIHKDAYLYDVIFISLTNDIEGYNSDLFDKIINSFNFTQTDQ